MLVECSDGEKVAREAEFSRNSPPYDTGPRTFFLHEIFVLGFLRKKLSLQARRSSSGQLLVQSFLLTPHLSVH